jgi:hypothetical protein
VELGAPHLDAAAPRAAYELQSTERGQHCDNGRRQGRHRRRAASQPHNLRCSDDHSGKRRGEATIRSNSRMNAPSARSGISQA